MSGITVIPYYHTYLPDGNFVHAIPLGALPRNIAYCLLNCLQCLYRLPIVTCALDWSQKHFPCFPCQYIVFCLS